jgi:hypothetical protein
MRRPMKLRGRLRQIPRRLERREERCISKGKVIIGEGGKGDTHNDSLSHTCLTPSPAFPKQMDETHGMTRYHDVLGTPFSFSVFSAKMILPILYPPLSFTPLRPLA